MPQIDPINSEPPTIGACAVCIRDSAHRCGMAGGARCLHIEQAGGGAAPKVWIVSPGEILVCLDFESDLAESAPLLH